MVQDVDGSLKLFGPRRSMPALPDCPLAAMQPVLALKSMNAAAEAMARL